MKRKKIEKAKMLFIRRRCAEECLVGIKKITSFYQWP